MNKVVDKDIYNVSIVIKWTWFYKYNVIKYDLWNRINFEFILAYFDYTKFLIIEVNINSTHFLLFSILIWY